MKYLGWEKAQSTNLHLLCPIPGLGEPPHMYVPRHTVGMCSMLGEKRRVQSKWSPSHSLGLSRWCWSHPCADEPRYSSCRCCRTEAKTIDHAWEHLSREEKRQHPDIWTTSPRPGQPPEVVRGKSLRMFNIKFDLSNDWVCTLNLLFTLKCLYSTATDLSCTGQLWLFLL